MEANQENPHQQQSQPPNKALKIMRRSIHTFLNHLHHFTSTPTLLALPFSLSLLLHLTSASASAAPHRLRLHAVLLAAGFPLNTPISQFFLLKLSQTLSSSLYSLPLSLSFLLLSKSSTLQTLKSLHHHRRRNPSTAAYLPLLRTQLCSLFVILAANSACFSLICIASAAIGPLPDWAAGAGAVFYSVVVAQAIVVCNLALIISGMEGIGGLSAILKASVLIKGRTLTALALALPANVAMAAIEVVFRCRIYGVGGERWVWGVAMEMVLIAYLYSVLIVGDTIVGCLFYQSCKEETEIEIEIGIGIGIEDEEVDLEEYACDLRKLRALEEGFSC